MVPYRIYLSGGGIAAAAHIGALQELQKHTPIRFIREFMGVSAGAFVAMCLTTGYTLDELLDFSVRFDFTEIKEMDSVPGWILHFGMDTGERLYRLVLACLHVKGLPSEFTFQDCLTRFGISLRIVATDINDACPIIFSSTTTPTYCIADAVRASMSAPYYFQPFICPVSNHYLVDGAVISNHPLFVLPDEEHGRTLSVLIRTSIEKKTHATEMVINEFMMRPLQIALSEKNKIESRFYDARCIQIMLGEVNILDFAMELEMKHIMIQKGKDAVREFMGKYKPRRRNSI
jgi:predicted acylesterase/phospholipase RssA